MSVVIYTDGACHPNPGPGGWAAILLWNEQEHVITGDELETTNNRMEIMGVLRGLQELKVPCDVEVRSDSKYVIQSVGHWIGGHPDLTASGWMQGWRVRNWRTSQNKEVKNIDLWEKMIEACAFHLSVKMTHVKGHAGNHYNERCDELAVSRKLALRQRLQEASE